MARISRNRVRASFNQAAQGGTRALQGRALEDLISYIMTKIPGVRLEARNELNAFDTEETDVAFWNDRPPDGLYFLPDVILAECKNWSAPVGSQEIAYFATRLRHRGLTAGLLFAAHGITGDAAALTAAHMELVTALQEGQRILVVTRAELEALGTSGELIVLLQKKICRLVVGGKICD